MIFRVALFCYEEGRKNPIRSRYRAPWKLGEELHTGMVLLKRNRCVSPGQHDTALIQPLQDSFWVDVKVGDSIDCYEGSLKVATALIVEVFD